MPVIQLNEDEIIIILELLATRLIYPQENNKLITLNNKLENKINSMNLLVNSWD